MTVDDQSKPTPAQTVFIVSKNDQWDTQASDVVSSCGMRCVSVSSVTTFLEAASELTGPACALIDLETPGIDWSSLDQQMLERDLKIPVVVVAEEPQLINAIEAVKSCVNFVIARPIDTHSIREMINAALESQKIVRHRFAVEQNYQRLLTLDERERSIVDLAVDGAPNKQIANRLGLSVKTIERIRKNAYQKLDVRSTAEMTRAVILGNLHDIVYPQHQPILATALSTQ
jgi:FixJ family two-component response regulator